MASLNVEAMADFVEATLKRYIMGKWADISLPLQKYLFMKKLFKDKTKKPEMEGPMCEWKLRIGNQGNAKFTGLFAVDTTNRVNVLTHADQPWSMSTVNYIYDLREPEFQGSKTKIINYMKVNEQGLMNDFAVLMESAIWTAPSSVNANPRPLCGIPFWLQPYGTTQRSTVATTLAANASTGSTGVGTGFLGGDPVGFPGGAGGIQTAQYTGWNNYAGYYSQISRYDFVEKIVNAMDYCYFEAPTDFAQLAGGMPDWGMFTTHPVLATCRRLLQAGNDNLGSNVADHSGTVMVRSTPLVWVPALTNPYNMDGSQNPAYDSQNPVYGVNWNTFEFTYLSGWSQVKHAPFRVANQHTVYMRCMDDTGQTICYDRRQNFMLWQNAT